MCHSAFVCVCQDPFIYVTPRINASCHAHECVILLHMCDILMRVTWRVRDMIRSHVPYGAHTRLGHIDGAAHPEDICNVPHSRVWHARGIRDVPYPPVQHHTYTRMALTTSATVYKYSVCMRHACVMSETVMSETGTFMWYLSIERYHRKSLNVSCHVWVQHACAMSHTWMQQSCHV